MHRILQARTCIRVASNSSRGMYAVCTRNCALQVLASRKCLGASCAVVLSSEQLASALYCSDACLDKYIEQAFNMLRAIKAKQLGVSLKVRTRALAHSTRLSTRLWSTSPTPHFFCEPLLRSTLALVV